MNEGPKNEVFVRILIGFLQVLLKDLQRQDSSKEVLKFFSTPLEKSSTTFKNLLDHTFPAFRIAISGTSTVSACRFLETI
jgi:hypothetical protein